MPAIETVPVLAAHMALGGAAGLIAGMFGVGGGMLIVPALTSLYHLCGLPDEPGIHAAMTVSMTSVVVTSFLSIRAHANHDAVDHQTLQLWGPFAVMGSVSGSFLSLSMHGAFLSIVFGTFLALMGLFMGFMPADMHVLRARPMPLAQRLMAAGIGFVSALVGIGGGSLTVPGLVICRTPMHRAIGTASAMGLLISLPAALVFVARHLTGGAADAEMTRVELISFLFLVPPSLLTAPAGARLAHRLPAVNLRRIFAFLLALIAVKMVWGVWAR